MRALILALAAATALAIPAKAEEKDWPPTRSTQVHAACDTGKIAQFPA